MRIVDDYLHQLSLVRTLKRLTGFRLPGRDVHTTVRMNKLEPEYAAWGLRSIPKSADIEFGRGCLDLGECGFRCDCGSTDEFGCIQVAVNVDGGERSVLMSSRDCLYIYTARPLDCHFKLDHRHLWSKCCSRQFPKFWAGQGRPARPAA